MGVTKHCKDMLSGEAIFLAYLIHGRTEGELLEYDFNRHSGTFNNRFS